MHIRTAACSCGQLKLTCTGEPVRISICHCLECQKRTGSVFGMQARYPRERVSISGVSSIWARTGDEGTTAIFHFCATCGSTLYWEPGGMPEFVAIAVGAFADPAFPSPRVSVYEDRRHAWVFAAGELEMEHFG